MCVSPYCVWGCREACAHCTVSFTQPERWGPGHGTLAIMRSDLGRRKHEHQAAQCIFGWSCHEGQSGSHPGLQRGSTRPASPNLEHMYPSCTLLRCTFLTYSSTTHACGRSNRCRFLRACGPCGPYWGRRSAGTTVSDTHAPITLGYKDRHDMYHQSMATQAGGMWCRSPLQNCVRACLTCAALRCGAQPRLWQGVYIYRLTGRPPPVATD